MANKPKRRVVTFDELGDGGDFMRHVDSPLSCGLIGGAYVEDALGSLLKAVLIDGETSNGLLNNPKDILSSYSPKADMCYCLGLIPKSVYNNVKNIAKIRNRFAHSHTMIDFTDAEVMQLCGELKLPEVTDQTGRAFDIKDHTLLEDIGDIPPEAYFHRAHFILAVTLMHMAIKTASVGVTPREPTEVAFAALVGGVSVDDPSERAPIIFYDKQRK